MRTSFLSLLLFVAAISPSFAAWSWLHPLPQGNSLSAVAFANPRWGYAVGNAGTIIATRDGGMSWVVQYEAVTDDLRDLVCVDSLSAWVVGDNGMILHTTDGGFRWLELSGVTVQGLNAAVFTDLQHGWLAGDGKTVLRTTNGGVSWNPGTMPAGQMGAGINSLAFPTSSEGWAAGYIPSGGGALWHSTNAGLDWIFSSTLPGAGQRISFTSPTTGYIVGSGGMFRMTTNGGASWSAQTLSTFGLNDILSSGTELWVVGDNATVLHSTNGGTTWTEEPRFMYASLNSLALAGSIPVAVGEYGAIIRREGSWTSQDPATIRSVNWLAFADRDHGVAAGQYGLLMRTTDGGLSWLTVTGISGDSYYGAELTDPHNGWVVGDLGIMLHTTDGGLHWVQQITGTPNTLLSVSFVDDLRGWAVGDWGELIQTTDGGNHWVRRSSGVSTVLYGVKFVDNLTGWAVGAGGLIRHTTDGGSTWTTQSSGTGAVLYAVDFVGAQLGFAAGTDGTIIRTTDAGLSWVPVSTGIPRPLYRVAGSGPLNLTAVGDSGTVLHSADGGASWQPEFASTGYHLYSIVTFGDSVRLACGENGTILRTVPVVASGIGFHDGASVNTPELVSLAQNYPNPFNPATMIDYVIGPTEAQNPGSVRVRLSIHDLLGREIAVLADGWRMPGSHSVRFDADRPSGLSSGLSSGVYLVRLAAGSTVHTRKMLLLR